MTHAASLPQAHADAAGRALSMAEWQSVVFAEAPRRIDLLRLAPDWPLRPLRIAVQRNEAFELLAQPLRAFLSYAGYSAEPVIGPYDDSLQFVDPGSGADVDVVWLGLDRYGPMGIDRLGAWLGERLNVLRAGSAAPIVVADVSDRRSADRSEAVRGAIGEMPGVRMLDVDKVAAELGEAFTDPRARAITGSGLSDRAAISLARILGFSVIPPLLEPRIKAVAVDLDGTLYAGVLGEDGADGVIVSDAHSALHDALIELHDQGVIVVLVSRNEPADVNGLLATRGDLGRLAHVFGERIVGWGPKADAIREAARRLAISPESFLFVDDNPGEIAAVAAGIIGIRCLLAVDPLLTSRALRHLPGLAGYRVGEADAVRSTDLATRGERLRLARSMDPRDYLRSLEVSISFSVDNPRDVARLADLSGKTNQFNTALRRFTEVELARRRADPHSRVVAARLRDRLSDSGTIGAIAAHRSGDTLVVDEVAISCRALGRQIEDILICSALVRLAADLDVEQVRFDASRGPRNEPAMRWLESLGSGVVDGSTVAVRLLAGRARVLADIVAVTWA